MRFANLADDAREDLTVRYEALCLHYGMEPTRNIKFRSRIDIERAALQPLPERRTDDFEEDLVFVTSSSGFVLRKVFYTAPSRLIGHTLRARLYDDRVVLHLGSTEVLTLQRKRRGPNGSHNHVVDYRHIIHSLRRKPMALMGLVYRDQLFPRPAYKRAFEALVAAMPEKAACRITVELLALAHERAREVQLADRLKRDLEVGVLPDIKVLREAFLPDAQSLPSVVVIHAPLIYGHQRPCGERIEAARP